MTRRRALVLGGIGAGIALRVWILRSALLGGYLDSDEAVAGPMARHFLHGDLTTFYWGQAYGGTLEIGLVAGVFGIGGSGSLTLRLMPMLLYALGALLVWRIGRRTIGEPGATVAGLLFWIWSGYFVFRSTREYGYQGVLLLLGLVILLLVLRLREQPTWRDAAGVGLAAGLGWWTSSSSEARASLPPGWPPQRCSPSSRSSGSAMPAGSRLVHPTCARPRTSVHFSRR